MESLQFLAVSESFMKIGWEIVRLLGFEYVDNTILETAIFTSKWHHSHIMKYAKVK